MTRVQEVMHLVRYDVLRTRWWWMAYMIVVGVAAVLARVVESGSPAASVHLFAWALGIAAIAFAATLTRDTSPFDSRAFLAAKPLCATARAVAMILQLIVVVLLTVVAAAWAAAPSGWPLRNGVVTLLPATTSFLLLLLAGGYVGMVTRTAAAATLVWVLGVVGAIFDLKVDGWGRLPFMESSVELLVYLVPLCLLASVVIVGLIAKPKHRRLAMTGGVALATVSLNGQCAVLVVPLAKRESRASVDHLAERVTLIQFGDSSISSNIIRGRIEQLRDDRYYRFEAGWFACAGRSEDGATHWEKSSVGDLNVHPDDSLVRAMLKFEGTSWKTSREPQVVRDVFSLGPACRTRMARVDSVGLRGKIVRYRLERMIEQPFRVGRLTEGRGQRWWLERGNDALELHLSSLLPHSQEDAVSSIFGASTMLDEPVVIAIDSIAQRVYRLDQGGYGSALAPIVLPAFYREHRYFKLRQERELELLLSANAARASIALYRWVRDGDIPVHFERAGGSWFRQTLD